jgi:cleavage stimulation factor subunit 3
VLHYKLILTFKAKKFLADKSPAYMTARTALREMRGLTDILPQHIIPRKPQFTELDRHVVTGWRAYIKWEESNPLNTENEALVNQRVGYALKKCMAQMRHFPELWYYSASYHLTNGLVSEGIEFLKCGVAACPKSFLLTFALAEMEEEGNNGDAVPDIFQALLKQLDDEIDEFSGKVAAEVEVARGPEIPLVSTIEKGEDSDHARLVRERDERGKLVQERWAKRIGEVKTAAGIVWVTYMRFTRRHGGLSAARKIFTKARKSPHQTWHVFEASALMEHRYGTSAKTGDNKEGAAVAVRVFELGLKQFSEDVDFVMSYLNYLLSVNDDTSEFTPLLSSELLTNVPDARALFERSVLKIPADKARPLWDTWAQFEYTYGDLTAVRKLEARFAEAFPKETPLKRFAARYTFHGIDEIALRDLGLARGRAAAPPPPLAASAANVFPPFPPGQIRPASPSQKRALSPPRSPARVDTFKRARAQSPPRGNFVPPAQNRFAPHQQQQQQGQGQRDTSPFPRAPVPGARPAAAATNGPPQALSWFVTRLPTAQSFDGPVFHADDIVGLFAGINANGTAASAAHAHAPAPAPSRPPMGRQGFRGPGRRF